VVRFKHIAVHGHPYITGVILFEGSVQVVPRGYWLAAAGGARKLIAIRW
jgi:hypothetical protein